ncbi:MAG: hypothetical protein HUU35_13595 [Armatimonadetes bacterium]|nr:hypothetical protein [Armatimonadota bacterium]
MGQALLRPVITTAAQRRWEPRLPPLLTVLYPPYQERFFLAEFSPLQLLLPRDAWRLAMVTAHTAALPLLAWRAPRWLLFGLLWKLVSYLPVLPFRLTLVHYYYIPQLGDAFLLGAAAALAVGWWAEAVSPR